MEAQALGFNPADTGALKDGCLRAQSRPTVGPKIAPEQLGVFQNTSNISLTIYLKAPFKSCRVNGLWLHILKTPFKGGDMGVVVHV